MTIKDRFLDYWCAKAYYGDYEYDLSIFERIVYGFAGVLFAFILVLGVVITVPLWGIPYVIYKFIKLMKC